MTLIDSSHPAYAVACTACGQREYAPCFDLRYTGTKHRRTPHAERAAAARRLWPAAQVTAVKAYALAHYEEGGWDVIVECWDDQQIADAILNAIGPIRTVEQAIAHFRDGVVAIYADQQADARNSAF